MLAMLVSLSQYIVKSPQRLESVDVLHLSLENLPPTLASSHASLRLTVAGLVTAVKI